MALISNGARLLGSPCSYYATLFDTNTAGSRAERGLWNNDGRTRNLFATEGGVSPLSSIPSGSRHPEGYLIPQKPGGLSSRNSTFITASQVGGAVRGLPGSGSADITLTADATGGLIVSGSGSASITFSPTGTILSVAAGSGTATITLTGTALIGALAGLSSQASITLSPAAAIRAVGYLSGLSTNEAEFSPDALARAVWDALSADYNAAGTMGEKLNSVGAAGNPWDAPLVGNSDPGTFGEQVQKLLTLSKFIALK